MDKIPLFAVHVPASVDKPLLQTLHSGYIGQGSKVEEFERKLADFIGNRNVLTVNSATSGLELALHLAGVDRNAEVISTPMTCTATNTPVISRGASLVWADVDPQTGLIDPIDVERKITKKTRAIIAVHWGGTPCDLDSLITISTHYNIPLIEDAAHSFGATYLGRKLGSGSSFATVYSFQAIKHITTGDGGALFLNSAETYKRGKLLRWYGIDRETERKDMRCEEDVVEAGWKWHMNDLNATMGIEQMEYIEGILKLHRENAKFYFENIKGPVPAFEESDLIGGAFWLYTILCSDSLERDLFVDWMTRKGIHVSKVHSAHHGHTAFNKFTKHPLPGVEAFAAREICIPVHWALTENQRDYIVDAVNSFYSTRIEVEDA